MGKGILTLLVAIVCCKDADTQPGLLSELSIDPNRTFTHTENELSHVTCTLTHDMSCEMIVWYHTNNGTLTCGSEIVICGTGSNGDETYRIIERTDPENSGVTTKQYVLEFRASKSLNGTEYHCTSLCATSSCQCSRSVTQQVTIIVQDLDLCTHATPCQNNGTCVMVGRNQYKCQCGEGYEGITCEKQTNCDPNPCLNGGTCMDIPADYQCACASGFTGRECSEGESEGSAMVLRPVIGVVALAAVSVLLNQMMT